MTQVYVCYLFQEVILFMGVSLLARLRVSYLTYFHKIRRKSGKWNTKETIKFYLFIYLIHSWT